MRIIRLKLNPEVKKYLRHTSRTFGIDDPGYTEDMFALIRLKGGGLPTKERIAKMSKTAAKRKKGTIEAGVNLLISKRKMVFMKMLALPYVHALMTLKDPIEATTRFITKMRSLYTKVRQAQCISCSLRAGCEFGKQYGDTMTDVTRVVDADFKKKVDPNCPALPEIGGFNQMIASIEAMLKLAQSAGTPEQAVAETLCKRHDAQRGLKEELADFDEFNEQAEELASSGFAPQEDDSPDDSECEGADFHVTGQVPEKGHSGVYDGSHSGNALCKVSENLIEKLTLQQLAIFELGRKFSTEITAQKKGKFKPVPHVEHDKRQEKMTSLSDVTKLAASQHGLPDEVFDARLEKKTLTKIQPVKPETQKQILYILSDNSASMTHFLGGDNRGVFTRGALSSVLSISLVRRTREDGGVVFFRFFSGDAGPLQVARTPQEYEALLDYLGTPSFRSGSTNIPSVIETACSDVRLAGDDMKKAEILLITDCEDSFTVPDIKELLKGAELNTLDVAGGSINSESAKALKSISSRFYKANESAPSIADIVSLI